jgi:hypothetical protein
MSYPAADDLVILSNIDELINLEPEEQEQLRRSSIAAVEEYTNQSFEALEDAELAVDGTGTKTLFLPKRLETLSELTVSGSGLTATDVILPASKDRLIVSAAAGIGNYYEKVMRDFDGNQPLRFTYGVGTVQISGDWGWDECPQDVADAILLDMEDQALADANQLSDTIRAARVLGLRDISQGNLRAAIDFTPSLSIQAQRLLLPYIWIGQVGATV